MRILVQKFGGTSVASRESRLAAAGHVERALSDGYRVVVVVSAMGRKGDPYATDTLLGTVDEADAVAKRDLDILMSCGETISAVVFASLLRARGHEVAVLTGGQAGIITNNQYGDARILEVRPDRILELLERGAVVVVTGFQGVTLDGDVTTLGRGGSDTTATALGVALGAEYVDIFTDVDGIMTADPRIVEDARRLRRVTYTEICNLAYQGAKVIHPRAVEIAMQKNVPIRVRSTHSQDEGTLVTSATTALESGALRERFVTGVTQAHPFTQLVMDGSGLPYGRIFEETARRGISLDFIYVSPDRIAYTVPGRDASLAVDIVRSHGVEPRVVPDCARVAVVGAGIAGVPGIMAKITGALASEGVEILQSADSHTTIWCLVHLSDMERAVRALHNAFELGQ
ncbi:aspartate kinase [Alicyclobacillus sp.]|uniref:aspartate kinase n=1 Tax=Alicyclobacillus sp. TaxID=61169 RepID=UPI0025C6FDFE|nr:aspartate kinase [Alicyclobacillus sp.]MCL6516220.1 aspartate kinase [Alicyclobacillus sp.]